jgi:hypothetical protein
MIVDIINAFFPFVGAGLVALNIKQLYNDKEVKGIHWFPPLFFYTGQAWGVYFFYSLGQYYSFVGASILLSVSMVWYTMMIYYKFFRDQK